MPGDDWDVEMFGEERPVWAMTVCGVKRPAPPEGGDRSKQANVGQGSGSQEVAQTGRGAKSNKELEELAELTARLALITAREQALLEGSVLETYLVPELHFLSKAGIEANRFYTGAVAGLKEQKKTDDSVDLGQLGPPFVTVFFMVMAAAVKAAQGAAQEPMANFFQTHVKGQPAEHITQYVTRFSIKVPRGEHTSAEMKGMVKFQVHIQTARPAGVVLREILDRILSEAGAERLVGSAPRGPLERKIGQLLSKRTSPPPQLSLPSALQNSERLRALVKRGVIKERPCVEAHPWSVAVRVGELQVHKTLATAADVEAATVALAAVEATLLHRSGNFYRHMLAAREPAGGRSVAPSALAPAAAPRAPAAAGGEGGRSCFGCPRCGRIFNVFSEDEQYHAVVALNHMDKRVHFAPWTEPRSAVDVASLQKRRAAGAVADRRTNAQFLVAGRRGLALSDEAENVSSGDGDRLAVVVRDRVAQRPTSRRAAPRPDCLTPSPDGLPQKVFLADGTGGSRSGSDHDPSDTEMDHPYDLADHLTKLVGLPPPPGLGLDFGEIAVPNRTPLRSKAAAFSPLRSQAEAFVPKGLALAGGQRVTSKAPGGGAQAKAQGWTTVMMRNVPHSYTCDKLIDLLESNGFSNPGMRGSSDFVYVPINFTQMLGVGYAFVNLTSQEKAEEFILAFEGFDGWESSFSKTACAMHWSVCQGLDENISRYRNSPLMCDDVPTFYKPVLLKDGVRIEFPKPTKQLRTLRRRKAKQQEGEGEGEE
ncbi:unnamed protein product [Prorocentrum cordatum]|uniref:Mei2-like C-terminal RNA recognition motif domain-containing protein n=1 Tax=Prorocentrum cordatum TaxID=2364126 RepID=A0ABN9WHD5_9DINO|nr:unnamed protein product [Polarella glacialis]